MLIHRHLTAKTRSSAKRLVTRKSKKNAITATTTVKKAANRNAAVPHGGLLSQARRKSSASIVKPGTMPTAIAKLKGLQNGARTIPDTTRSTRKNVAHGSRPTTPQNTQKYLSANTGTTATHKRNTLALTRNIKTNGSISLKKRTE